MTRTFTRLRYIFLGLFLIGAAGSGYYQIRIVKPRQDCERAGGWWDGDERICATPVDISRITGRPNRARSATDEPAAAAPLPVQPQTVQP